MTCSTCKYWIQRDTRYNTIVFPYKDTIDYIPCRTEGEVEKVYGYKLRYCESPKVLFYQKPDINGAAICDGSEYQGYLITGPNFGCVNYDAK